MCTKLFMALIIVTHPNPKSKTIKPIAKNICYYANKRKLDPYLILGLIRHESNFRTRCVSRTNDYGLMQINIKYRRYKCNLFNIRCNIKEGTKKMAIWKRAFSRRSRTHWLRHYNWNNKQHHLRVLWVAEAYRRNKSHLFKMIIKRRYTKLKLNYKCINRDLCGADPGEQNVVKKEQSHNIGHF